MECTALLQKDEVRIWSITGVSAIELRDSWNLALLGDGNETIWESFSHPTDTLLLNQDFMWGMRLVSRAKSTSSKLSYTLEFNLGDMMFNSQVMEPDSLIGQWTKTAEIWKMRMFQEWFPLLRCTDTHGGSMIRIEHCRGSSSSREIPIWMPLGSLSWEGTGWSRSLTCYQSATAFPL